MRCRRGRWRWWELLNACHLSKVGASVSGTPSGQRPHIFAISMVRACAGVARPCAAANRGAVASSQPRNTATFSCSLRYAMKVPLRLNGSGHRAQRHLLRLVGIAEQELARRQRPPDAVLAHLAVADDADRFGGRVVLAVEHRIADAVEVTEMLVRDRLAAVVAAG